VEDWPEFGLRFFWGEGGGTDGKPAGREKKNGTAVAGSATPDRGKEGKREGEGGKKVGLPGFWS